MSKILVINITSLAAQGWPDPGTRGVMLLGNSSLNYEISADMITLDYVVRSGQGAGKNVRCQIKIVATPQPNGEPIRLWTCPTCGQATDKLYLASDARSFQCQRCQRTEHEQAREIAIQEHWKAIEDIAQRYGEMLD